MLPFEEARKIVRDEKLYSQAQYLKFQKDHDNLPYNPWRTYANSGWVDWYDWLGKTRPDEDPDSSS